MFILQLSLLSFVIYGYICPENQETDSNIICNIFQSTNIENQVPHNFADNNYCSWSYDKIRIGCDHPTDIVIDWIEFERRNNLQLSGTLNLESGWPKNLKKIDLETTSSSSNKLSGEWDWQSIQGLHNITEINIRYNEFSGTMTSDDWITIASLKSLKFSNTNIPHTNSKLQLLDLLGNNLYGSLDTKSDGFFSTLTTSDPYLQNNDTFIIGGARFNRGFIILIG